MDRAVRCRAMRRRSTYSQASRMSYDIVLYNLEQYRLHVGIDAAVNDCCGAVPKHALSAVTSSRPPMLDGDLSIVTKLPLEPILLSIHLTFIER
ncbi:hypothetical protein BHE74_00005121 [Ensete ventricosum]|nr:hypothetical protein GW17_00017336 [Ensete ventricosum]RWW86116.1 hypothetical protein BHE74_00005121 [Ensete ventricosum]